MKTLKKITFLLLTALIVSCGSDDDNSTSSTNKFSIQGLDYVTPNGYLILDDGPSYTNAFILTFLEGTMREDNVNGSSISTNTNHGIALSVKLGTNQVTSEQAITNTITSGTTFTLSDDGRAITDITSYSNVYTFSGVQYGDPDDATANLYEINNLGSGSVTVNSFTVDLTARTGTVDCNYTITDENNVVITGSYNGTFEIINEF